VLVFLTDIGAVIALPAYNTPGRNISIIFFLACAKCGWGNPAKHASVGLDGIEEGVQEGKETAEALGLHHLSSVHPTISTPYL
jgi:hypothetical protein